MLEASGSGYHGHPEVESALMTVIRECVCDVCGAVLGSLLLFEKVSMQATIPK